MSGMQLYGEFSKVRTTFGDTLLAREELHAVTAIVPSGVWLNDPVIKPSEIGIEPGLDSRWRWRVATWPDRLASQSDASPQAVAVAELPALLQAQPDWAAWMLKEMTQQMTGLHTVYSKQTDDPLIRLFPDGIVSVLREAQTAVTLAYDSEDLKRRVPYVVLAVARGAVNYAAPLLESFGSAS